MKTLAAVLLLAVVASAQTTRRHPEGFSVILPPGWNAEQTGEAFRLVPPSAAPEEGYFVTSRTGYNPNDEPAFVAQMSRQFQQNGGQVRRAGDRQSLLGGGSAYHWEVFDPKTQQLGAFSLYLLPAADRAHVILALGPADRVRAQQANLPAILQSIRFQALPPGVMSPLARQWDDKLRGKLIRQFWASQGMSSDKKHLLRADGTYSFTSSSMVSVDVPGASAGSFGKDDQTGRWRISESSGRPFLEVTYQSGRIRQFALTQDAKNWYLDGEKAFAVEP
jgi:hypothetical protein